MALWNPFGKKENSGSSEPEKPVDNPPVESTPSTPEAGRDPVQPKGMIGKFKSALKKTVEVFNQSFVAANYSWRI